MAGRPKTRAKKAAAKAAEPESVIQILSDPVRRIEEAKLYHIVTKDFDERGKPFSEWKPFEPFWHQKQVIRKIHRDGCRRLLIPKARQMGCSTVINLDQLDSCYFKENFHARIIDQTAEDAEEKLVNRVHRAAKWVEENLEYGLKIKDARRSEINWTNNSRFTAGARARGIEAVHYLHVSELGPIDWEDPKRAQEIVEGAFEAASGGIIVVESTAKGPQGQFRRLCEQAQEINAEDRTSMDWELLFFSWHQDPRYAIEGKYERISKKTNEYLDYVQAKLGKNLTPQQRLWYEIKARTVPNMRYEYPSLLHECWEQPVEGAIYAEDISDAREDGRLGRFEYARELPVFTIWDLGAPENTRCIFFQLIQSEIRIIDAAMGGYDAETRIDGPREPADWASLLHDRSYSYGAHIFPHDANIKQYSGSSFETDLRKLGVGNLVRLARRRDAENQRINETRMAFNRFVFNTANTMVDTLIKHLSVYHRRKEHDGVTVKEKPHHDFSSHFADAFGSIYEATQKGLTKGGGGRYSDRKKNRPRLIKYSAYR